MASERTTERLRGIIRTQTELREADQALLMAKDNLYARRDRKNT